MSAPSRGSEGMSAGGDVMACVPSVTWVFVYCGRLQLNSTMCKFVLLSWGEPEFPRGQGQRVEILVVLAVPCFWGLVAAWTACVETMMER
jgi:hypothetical protein